MQQKRKVELLAPAGNMEKLKTAFHFGADACFVGGSAFNLRGMSSNFKNSELKKAIDYVHSLGKRIFVTLNIFAHNSEIEYMPRFIRLLDEYGADAVIVADLGVFQLVREHAPNLPIHVSTQANNTNWMSVKTWRDMGAKRVILAREMSLNEIRTIKEPEKVKVKITKILINQIKEIIKKGTTNIVSQKTETESVKETDLTKTETVKEIETDKITEILENLTEETIRTEKTFRIKILKGTKTETSGIIKDLIKIKGILKREITVSFPTRIKTITEMIEDLETEIKRKYQKLILREFQP